MPLPDAISITAQHNERYRTQPDALASICSRFLRCRTAAICERFVARRLAKFDALTAEAQRAIDLLQERRTALISAAVTGKIDVRGLVETEAA